MINRFNIKKLIIIFIGFTLALSLFTVLSSAKSENDVECSQLDERSKILFGETEKQVLQEFEEQKNSTQVYALLSGGGWGGNGHIIITLDKENATLKYIQGNGRYITRILKKSELEEFLSFVENESVDSLKPLDHAAICDGTEYLFLHASRDKIISRVYDYSPVNKVYRLLVYKFDVLANKKGFSVNYDISKKLRESKVLIPHEKNKVLSVWKQKNDFRVLVQEKGGVNWREFKSNTIGKVESEPQGFIIKEVWKDIPNYHWFADYLNSYPLKSNWGEYIVRILDSPGPEGIWLTKRGGNPILIHEGRYADPVVIAGSEWVIVAKIDKDWSQPNTVVKINLKTKLEYDLGITPAQTLYPIAFVPENNKVLLVSKKDFNSDEEYLLYDIKTGKSEKSPEYFEPLCQQTYRTLQFTGEHDEYWAAVPSDNDGNTDIGTYNAKTFKFTKLFTYPDIIFDSMDMWVDTESKHIYVVINNDLLELPFIYK